MDSDQTVDALVVQAAQRSLASLRRCVRASCLGQGVICSHDSTSSKIRAMSSCVDLPTGKSRWGGGITAEDMREMRCKAHAWSGTIRFVESTAERTASPRGVSRAPR